MQLPELTLNNYNADTQRLMRQVWQQYCETFGAEGELYASPQRIVVADDGAGSMLTGCIDHYTVVAVGPTPRESVVMTNIGDKLVARGAAQRAMALFGGHYTAQERKDHLLLTTPQGVRQIPFKPIGFRLFHNATAFGAATHALAPLLRAMTYGDLDAVARLLAQGDVLRLVPLHAPCLPHPWSECIIVADTHLTHTTIKAGRPPL